MGTRRGSWGPTYEVDYYQEYGSNPAQFGEKYTWTETKYYANPLAYVDVKLTLDNGEQLEWVQSFSYSIPHQVVSTYSFGDLHRHSGGAKLADLPPATPPNERFWSRQHPAEVRSARFNSVIVGNNNFWDQTRIHWPEVQAADRSAWNVRNHSERSARLSRRIDALLQTLNQEFDRELDRVITHIALGKTTTSPFFDGAEIDALQKAFEQLSGAALLLRHYTELGLPGAWRGGGPEIRGAFTGVDPLFDLKQAGYLVNGDKDNKVEARTLRSILYDSELPQERLETLRQGLKDYFEAHPEPESYPEIERMLERLEHAKKQLSY